MIKLFIFGPGVSFTIYTVLQLLAAFKLKGAWKLGALVPLPFTIWVIVSTIDAYKAESNLWPVGIIFYGLIASGYIIFIFFGSHLYTKLRKRES